MNDQEMKRLLQSAIDHRLSGLKENPFLARRIIAAAKGERPMKKKLSVSLMLVLALTLMMLGLAYALVQSRIAGELYGDTAAPSDVADRIQMPDETASSDLGVLVLDELLYDGSALHTAFTLSNPTEETLLYTVDGLYLDRCPLTRSTLFTEGAGTAGYLLGGTLDGLALPTSVSAYNEAEALYAFDGQGEYLGTAPVPEGEATLRIDIAVWRPIHSPRLVDYGDYEGMNVSESSDRLVTDETGYVSLELFRPEAYSLNATADKPSSEIYAQAYRELGWAELAGQISLELDVTLGPDQLTHVRPVQTEYTFDNLTLTISRFDLTHTGGQMEGRLSGEGAETLLKQGFLLVDPDGQRVLSNVLTWDQEGAQDFSFCLSLVPVAGELPRRVCLAPFLAHDPHWDESSPSYDPDVEKPEGVVGAYQLDFAHALCIALEKSG